MTKGAAKMEKPTKAPAAVKPAVNSAELDVRKYETGALPPAHLKPFGGTDFDAFNETIVLQSTGASWAGVHGKDGQKTLDFVCAALISAEPRDAIEGMLITQMVATHNAAMECYRRAMIPEQTFAGRESALTHASKLTRSYSTLVQALDKHRGKGQQTVRVEHVHVHSGGQAIVGNVGPGQAGAIIHSPEQPFDASYEQVTDALLAPGGQNERD